jgi:hypothetical protein
MGSDAEVFLFDHDAYLRTVVPTILKLLEDSPLVDWLQPSVKRRDLKPWLWDKSDLTRYLNALNPDLSCAAHYDLNDTFAKKWEERWSDFVDAAERNGFVQREAPAEELVEQVNWLFKIAVSLKSIGASQFVGRSRTVSHFSELLPNLGVKEDDRIVTLLAALGKRGFLIGYQFGFGFEGINGWLDPSETAELFEKLDRLPLPRYEASFTAMRKFRTGEWGEYECPGFSSEALSLSFVRTTAAIAAREHRGILWGNDVMPPEYYLEQPRL